MYRSSSRYQPEPIIVLRKVGLGPQNKNESVAEHEAKNVASWHSAKVRTMVEKDVKKLLLDLGWLESKVDNIDYMYPNNDGRYMSDQAKVDSKVSKLEEKTERVQWTIGRVAASLKFVGKGQCDVAFLQRLEAQVENVRARTGCLKTFKTRGPDRHVMGLTVRL